MISSTQTNQPFVSDGGDERSAKEFTGRAIEILRQAGLRITQSRVQLLLAIARSAEALSIEELHECITEPRCDLVTIYRCMLVFEEHGLVQRGFRFSGTTVFERRLDQVAPYRIHFRDQTKTIAIPEYLSREVRLGIMRLERHLQELGYAQVSHILEFFATSATADPASKLQPGNGQCPILVVDDNEHFRNMLQEVLHTHGYTTRTAASGKEALAIAAAENFSAVLTDFDMEGMNGLILCQAIKNLRDGAFQQTPVWIMTGSRDVRSIDNARAYGAVGVLQKPFSVSEVIGHIQSQNPKRASAASLQEPAIPDLNRRTSAEAI